MTDYFRVTVEDLRTGGRQAMEVASGDYMLIPFGTCVLTHTQRSANGTVQITLRGHQPLGPPRPGAAGGSSTGNPFPTVDYPAHELAEDLGVIDRANARAREAEEGRTDSAPYRPGGGS